MKKISILAFLVIFLGIFSPRFTTPPLATVTVEYSKMTPYNGAGTTGPFAYTFKIWSASDLVVIQTDANGVETVLTLNVDYTVTGAGVATGGNVTLTTALPAGETLTIMRDMSYLQGQNWTAGQAITASSLNNVADKLEHQIQQVNEKADRAFQVPARSTISTPYLAPSASHIIGWDTAGTGLYNYPMTTLTVPVLDHVSNYASLAAAVTAIGASNKALYIDTECTLTANTNVPENIELVFARNGSIARAGFTLTLGREPNAGLFQIFTGAGSTVFTGKVTVHTAWFTSDRTGATDQATELQDAANAAKTHSMRASTDNYEGSRLIIDPGSYLINTTLFWGENSDTHSIRYIEGYGATIIGETDGTPIIDMTGAMICDLRGFTLVGGSTTPPNIGVLEARQVSGASAGSHFWNSVNIYGNFTLCAWYNYASEANSYKNAWVEAQGTAEAVFINGDTNTESVTSAFTTIGSGYYSNTDFQFEQFTMVYRNSTPPADAAVARFVGVKNIEFAAGTGFAVIEGKTSLVPAVTFGKAAAGQQNYGVTFNKAYFAESSTRGIHILDGGAIWQLAVLECWSTIYATAAEIAADAPGTPAPYFLLTLNGSGVVYGLEYRGNHPKDGINAVGATADINHANVTVGYDCYFARGFEGVIRHPKIRFATASTPLTITWNTPTYVFKVEHFDDTGLVKNDYARTTTAVSTSGTGEDVIGSGYIPAGAMELDSGVIVKACGTKTGAAGNKTLKFRFGSTTITFHAAANNQNDWKFEAWVFNTGATNTQGISWVGYDGTTLLQGYDTAAEDSTAAIYARVTGECADAGDTITQTMHLMQPR